MGRRPALVVSLLACSLLSSTALAGAADKAPRRHSLILRQSGSSASFEKRAAGRFRLTVHGVPRRSSYVATHPLRVDHRVATGKVLRRMFKRGPRLGAVEAPGERGDSDAIAAMLSAPAYSAATGTLSYTVEPLRRAPGSGVTPAGLSVDETLPTELGETTVNVGSPHDGLSCFGELSIGKEEVALELLEAEWQILLGFSKWSTDSWALEPLPRTEEGQTPSSPYLNWQTNGGDDRGCHNAVEFEGKRNLPEEPSGVKMVAEMTYDWGNHAHTNCVVTPTAINPRVCEITTTKEGIFDTDLFARFYGGYWHSPKEIPFLRPNG
jgi:hypothetical protein